MSKKLNPISWIMFALVSVTFLYFLIPGRTTKAPVQASVVKTSKSEPRERGIAKTSGARKAIVRVPPRTIVISTDSSDTGETRESVAKLESELSPDDLQLFYTDLLLNDWIVLRDSLTEGVGWSGVFLQIDEPEKRLGIFANVETIGPTHSDTRISLFLVEES